MCSRYNENPLWKKIMQFQLSIKEILHPCKRTFSSFFDFRINSQKLSLSHSTTLNLAHIDHK